MDFIIQYCWQVLRDFKHYMVVDKRSILCQTGFHDVRRGFGWSSGRRMDVCLRHDCKWSKWYEDKNGSDIISGK